MERTRGQLSQADAPSLRVVTRAEREAAETQPAPSGIFSGPLIGTHVGSAIGTSSDQPSGEGCRHCNPR